MSSFFVTPEAESDLAGLIDYIATDSADAAVKVRNKLYETFESLGRTPGLGHYWEELLGRRYRVLTVYSYLVVYQWNVTPVQIIAVVHGARDLKAYFDQRRLS